MSGRIDQINHIEGFPEKVQNVPPNYPTQPGPGKISLLWKFNYQNLWHRFSPYTYGDNIFGVYRNKQPFVYRYPDEAQNSTFNQLPAAVKTLAASGNITQGTIDDVVRVSKFLVTSPEGGLYNIKQFTLQRLNPFDETRVYNPLSPVLATIAGMTFGIGDRPRRHIEGNFLTGIVNSLASTIGVTFESGFATPKSTTAYGKESIALPKENISNAKGLIRGATAKTALTTLQTRWSGGQSSNLGFGGLLDSIKGTFKSFFGGAPSQSSEFRGDEDTYETMRVSKGKLDSFGKNGQLIPLEVRYWPTGRYVDDATISVTIEPKFTDYSETNPKKYPSTFSDDQKASVIAVNAALEKILTGINSTDIYYASKVPASYLLPGSSYDAELIRYDNWKNKQQTAQKIGAAGEYADNRNGKPKTIDSSVSPNNLRMATSFRSDALNRVGVLNADKKVTEAIEQYPDFVEYKPYEDDLIAFFFYDVVNEKYIPFRATVKGISEGNTAFWDELRFIGRADQLYSYNGFSRTLSFTFNVVVSSIKELLPTWQKINYMASCVKPANYTVGAEYGKNYNRFIVPPMFMMTMGDLYKFQPIVVTSINVNIPDDASWETLNEENAPRGWSYLNGIISAQNVKYAQLPREAEIAVTCNLLEKERAIVGGSHFGHAPRKDDGVTLMESSGSGQPYLPKATSFHSSMIVNNTI